MKLNTKKTEGEKLAKASLKTMKPFYKNKQTISVEPTPTFKVNGFCDDCNKKFTKFPHRCQPTEKPDYSWISAKGLIEDDERVEATEKPMKITSTDTKQKIELTLRSFAERLEKCNLEGVPMGAKRYYKFVDQLYSLYQEGWEEEHCNCVEHYVGEKGKGYWIHARAELLSTLKKVT